MKTRNGKIADWAAALFMLGTGGGIAAGGTWHYASGIIAERDAALSSASAKLKRVEAGLLAERAAVSTAWYLQTAAERQLAKTDKTIKSVLTAQAGVKQLAKKVERLTDKIKAAPAKMQKSAEKPQANAPTIPAPVSAPDKPVPAAPEKIERRAVAQDNASRMLDALNKIRAEHGLPPLAWSKKLMDGAGVWAQKLIKRCELEHDPAWNGGENLVKGHLTPEEAVAAWAGEEKDFYFASGTCAEGKVCGHWTQIVQRDAREVGCQQFSCPDGSPILACRWYVGNTTGKRPF